VKRAIVALLLFVVACVAPAEEENVSSTAPLARTSTPWSVSRHVWPSADADLARDLDLVAELGARYVRTDVWWYSVEPERGKYDRAALDAYSRFFDEAKKRGLEVLVVLSNAPAWARALYERGAREAFFAAFGRYAFEVAKLAGSRVQNYQLWNEPNHVIDFVDGEGDIQLFVRGRAGIDAAVPGRTTMINLLVDGHDLPIGPSWMTDVDFYLQHGAGRAIDVIGIDHYPGTWAYGDWGGNILDRLGALGRRYGKAVAVLETGLSTTPCTMPWNSEAQQAKWIGAELGSIRTKTRALEASGVRVAMLNWFKLEDRETSDCFDPEDHFGVVRSDRSKKPGFDALRRAIASFAR
jgi:hypothetical protein